VPVEVDRTDALVGGNLRRLRGAETQDRFASRVRADELGLPYWTQATVAGVESGRRRLRLAEVASVCVVLGCSPGDLFEGDRFAQLALSGRIKVVV
jgi:DNA-binding Xre family transcriptional regulator